MSDFSAALDPPRAHGAPLARGTLRLEPEDFLVEEDLGFTAAGVGQHVLLKVRKRNANTQWVARELGKLCACHPRDVGYAGLKDRRSVAIQWFTVPRSKLTLEAWREVRHPPGVAPLALLGDPSAALRSEFAVLEAYAHSRKLPRGALAGNHFNIRVRNIAVDAAALSERVARIIRHGVPNYFGPQRFGREGANLLRITDGLDSLRPPERGFVLSAARSLVFNAVLAARVADQSWDQLETGDIANLDGRGSIFAIDALDPTLGERCRTLDIHPTGPLWGTGSLPTHGRPGELEARTAAAFPQECTLVAAAGMKQERRALRLAVRDLTSDHEPDAVMLRFRLARGSFATTVLREIIAFDTLAGDERDEG